MAILQSYRVHASDRDGTQDGLFLDELCRGLRYLDVPWREVKKARVRLWKDNQLVLTHKTNTDRPNIMDGRVYTIVGE